jgi:hypothetical protein
LAYFRVQILNFEPERCLHFRVKTYMEKGDSDNDLTEIRNVDYHLMPGDLIWTNYFANARIEESGKSLVARIYEYLKTSTTPIDFTGASDA